jgi:hypothetical protein
MLEALPAGPEGAADQCEPQHAAQIHRPQSWPAGRAAAVKAINIGVPQAGAPRA